MADLLDTLDDLSVLIARAERSVRARLVWQAAMSLEPIKAMVQAEIARLQEKEG